MYLGGWFTAVGATPRSRLAAFSATTGKLRGLGAEADDTVDALVATPDQKKVIVGGRFLRLNGTKAWGLAALDAKTGSPQAWKINTVIQDYGPNAGSSAWRGQDHGLRQRLRVRRRQLRRRLRGQPERRDDQMAEDCHGDTYSVAPIGGVVYAVGHAHFCSNIGGFPDTPRAAWPPGPRHDISTADGHGGRRTGSRARTTGTSAGQPAPSLFNWFPDLAPGHVHRHGAGRLECRGQLQLHRARR